MQTILCVKCGSSFQIDETSLTEEIKSIRCPFCSEKINLRGGKHIATTITCPECNENIPEDSIDCPKCGYPLKKIINSNLDQAKQAHQNAIQYYIEGNFEEAHNSILIALNLSPTNVDYIALDKEIDAAKKNQLQANKHYNNAVDHYDNKDFKNAALEIEKALKLFNDPDYDSLNAKIQRKIEEQKNAINILSEAEKLYNDGEFEKAYTLVEQVSSIFPRDSEYQELKSRITSALAEQRYKIAQQYYSEKKYKDCQTTINECLKLVPEEERYNDLKSLVVNNIYKKVALKIGLIILIVAAITIPSVIYFLNSKTTKKDKEAWTASSNTNTISSYESYISQYPEGRYYLLAKNKKDSLFTLEQNDWDYALRVNEANAYKAFIQKHPYSAHISAAKDKIQAIKSVQEERSRIIDVIKRYYLADSKKDFDAIANFFEFNIIEYYYESNVTRDRLIQILSDYWTKSDLIQSKSDIDFESLKIDTIKGGMYKVSFKNNYEVLRSDQSKPNHFLTNTYVTFNLNLKIISISGKVISKWNGESTFSQTRNDLQSYGNTNGSQLTQIIDGVNYKISYPSTWTNYGRQMGAEFLLFPNNPINSDWIENINLVIENLNSTISLNSYVSRSLGLMQNAFTNYKLVNSSSTVGRSGAYQIVIYTYKYEYQELQAMQHIYIAFNKAYVLTFTSKLKDFDSLFYTASETMNTFIIKY